ncbi:Rz1-like lysis system protein LysC [Billgrantia aerodenitrificans]|uniref:Rz1-like lysis system protein LysC n=1 Tax=Billgrantia aerodenitrificans TaxID=2733483 RepID=UPI003BEEE6BC
MTLSACSTTPPPAALPIQQSLLQRCPVELPELTDGTGGDVALTMSAWASQYHRCATRHNGLVDAIESHSETRQ